MGYSLWTDAVGVFGGRALTRPCKDEEEALKIIGPGPTRVIFKRAVMSELAEPTNWFGFFLSFELQRLSFLFYFLTTPKLSLKLMSTPH